MDTDRSVRTQYNSIRLGKGHNGIERDFNDLREVDTDRTFMTQYNSIRVGGGHVPPSICSDSENTQHDAEGNAKKRFPNLYSGETYECFRK